MLQKMSLQYFEFGKLQCIEMAIWLLLYVKEKWCESNLPGQVYTMCSQFKINSQKKFKINFYYVKKQAIIKKMPQIFKFYIFHRYPDCPRNICFSAKHMFRAKLHSEILDFSNNFELLQFHFDRWPYKTVSG